MSCATSPGKVILFGEHAVVYGQPSIAIPVEAVHAQAVVETTEKEGIELVMLDLEESLWLHEAEDTYPLACAVRSFFSQSPELALLRDGLRISLTSTVPIAGGMGSGAALSSALFRGLARHYNMQEFATDEVVSKMTYEIERLYHGTPSGVDNTVVTYNQPVYFVRDLYQGDPEIYNLLLGDDGYQLYMPGLNTFQVGGKFSILIADTGIAAPTSESVQGVRNCWERNRYDYEGLFIRCGQIANEARYALLRGDNEGVGALMNFNHYALQAMGVSSDELDALVEAARAAGALGAKMSGGGRGGNMIALVNDDVEEAVRLALLEAGATSIMKTVLE
ncbi:MAG: mevalonate kinase [Candidatus Promineifilaceae bacterium]|jgi:mevalonate kinase